MLLDILLVACLSLSIMFEGAIKFVVPSRRYIISKVPLQSRCQSNSAVGLTAPARDGASGVVRPSGSATRISVPATPTSSTSSGKQALLQVQLSRCTTLPMRKGIRPTPACAASVLMILVAAYASVSTMVPAPPPSRPSCPWISAPTPPL